MSTGSSSARTPRCHHNVDHWRNLSLHHGLTPQQGHYTSIFLEGGSERAWHANDGATAKPVDAERLSSLAADAYLLWYRRLH